MPISTSQRIYGNNDFLDQIVLTYNPNIGLERAITLGKNIEKRIKKIFNIESSDQRAVRLRNRADEADQINQFNSVLAILVLIIGMGGLGCPVAEFLTRSGIGSLGIVDHDKISLSNIHRQSLFNEKDLDQPKVKIAKKPVVL